MGPFLKNGDHQMSHCLRRLISPIAAVAGILAVGVATPARADLEIWASTAGPPTAADKVAFMASGTGFQTVSYNNAAFGGFNIAALATSSDTPGFPTVAFLAGSSVTVANNNAGSATLWITLGDTSYMAPTTPPNISVNSHVANTIIVGGAGNAETFQSYINSDNSQNGTTGMTGGPQTPSITGPLGSTSDVFSTITSLASPYSLTETFKITLDAGSSMNFSSNTTLTQIPSTSVPEPSTLALTGLGTLGLVGYGLRRRKARGA
jgi:hypothetical protein